MTLLAEATLAVPVRLISKQPTTFRLHKPSMSSWLWTKASLATTRRELPRRRTPAFSLRSHAMLIRDEAFRNQMAPSTQSCTLRHLWDHGLYLTQRRRSLSALVPKVHSSQRERGNRIKQVHLTSFSILVYHFS